MIDLTSQVQRVFFSLALLGLVAVGTAYGQASSASDVAIRDPVTGCVFYIRIPASLTNPKLGLVTGGYRADTPTCANGFYQGKVMVGLSATYTSAAGVVTDFQSIRYGYAVDGRITGLLVNMFAGSVVVTDNGQLIKQFYQSDASYNIQQIYDALAERAASYPNYDLKPINFVLKMYDSNYLATVKYFAKGQSDDLKVFGRSVADPLEASRRLAEQARTNEVRVQDAQLREQQLQAQRQAEQQAREEKEAKDTKEFAEAFVKLMDVLKKKK